MTISLFTRCREGGFSESYVISGEEGWAETYTLHEDGTVEKTFHEAISEEAKRIRESSLCPAPTSSSAPEHPKGRSPSARSRPWASYKRFISR